MTRTEINLHDEAAVWRGTAAQLVAEARQIPTVRTQDDMETAGEIQQRLTKHIKALEAERMALTRPLQQLCKDLIAQEKEMTAEVVAEKQRLAKANSTFATWLDEEQQRIRREALQAAAEQQMAMDEGELEDTAPVVEVPAAHKPTTGSTATVETYTWDVIDESQVPREFLRVDERKLNAHRDYCRKLGVTPSVAGVRFVRQLTVRSR